MIYLKPHYGTLILATIYIVVLYFGSCAVVESLSIGVDSDHVCNIKRLQLPAPIISGIIFLLIYLFLSNVFDNRKFILLFFASIGTIFLGIVMISIFDFSNLYNSRFFQNIIGVIIIQISNLCFIVVALFISKMIVILIQKFMDKSFKRLQSKNKRAC